MSERPATDSLDSGEGLPAVHADASSFDTVFRRYAPYVGAIALRIVGRESDVDDVVQDVFLDAYRSIRGLREPAAIKGWLARITVRVSTRKLKRRRLRALFHFDQAPDYERVAHPAASPETQLLVARVYRQLDALPAEERVSWTLRHVAGEELEQIAVLTKASLATVKRRIARAQAALNGGDHGRA